jgi:hypothetical protein
MASTKRDEAQQSGRWRYFTPGVFPLVASLIVVGVAWFAIETFYKAPEEELRNECTPKAASCPQAIATPAPATPVPLPPGYLDRLAELSLWASSVFLFVLGGIAAIGTCACAAWTLLEEAKPRIWYVATVAVSTMLVCLVAHQIERADVAPHCLAEVRNQLLDCFHTGLPAWIRRLDLVAIVIALLFMLTFAATLHAGEGSTNVVDLRRRDRWVRSLVISGGVFLALGMFEIIALYRFVQTLAPDLEGIADAGHTMANTLGILSSVFLGALYFPTMAVLSRRALDVAPAEERAPPHHAKWLEENGLRLSIGSQLVRVAALASPALAGGWMGQIFSIFGG